MAHIVVAFGKECVQNNVRSKNFGSKHLKPKKNLDTKRFLVQKNISNKKFVKQMIQKVSDEKNFSRKNKNYMDFVINKLIRIGPRQCMNLFHTTSKFSISWDIPLYWNWDTCCMDNGQFMIDLRGGLTFKWEIKSFKTCNLRNKKQYFWQ